MKKLHFLLLVTLTTISVSAQTKTAYLDLYMRGGGQHLKTTLIFNGSPIYLGRTNLGTTLNTLAQLEWEVDNKIEVERHPFFSMFTRHKFHIILKKVYQEGEIPFNGLGRSNISGSLHSNSNEEPFEGDVISVNKMHNKGTIPGNVVVETIEISLRRPYIAPKSFQDRIDIARVTLEESVTGIGNYAFARCSQLKEIFCKPTTPPSVNSTVFLSINSEAVIYVPRDAVEQYKSAKGWEIYSHIIKGYDF